MIAGTEHPLRPGAVVVIPAGVSHELCADAAGTLEFVIFGTPPMYIDDPRARPERPEHMLPLDGGGVRSSVADGFPAPTGDAEKSFDGVCYEHTLIS